MGLISRLFLLFWIPIRLAVELFQCYIWTPKAEEAAVPVAAVNGSTNGSTYGSAYADHQVSPDNLTELNEAMDKWWGPTTPLLGLRAMNKVRVPIIVQAYYKDVLGRDFDVSVLKSPSPLLGAKVCDVGCGGGYLTEALTEAGADVVGIEENNLDLLAAKTHWKETRGMDDGGPEYHHVTVQEFSEKHQGEFDVVICSELIEHLAKPMDFIPYCLKMVKEGGCVVFTTNNRTLWALLYAIIWLEHVVAIIPVNTHHLYKFILPEEIDTVLRRNGFVTTDVIGYLPIGLTARLTWRLQWFLTTFIGVWYGHVAKKPIANN